MNLVSPRHAVLATLLAAASAAAVATPALATGSTRRVGGGGGKTARPAPVRPARPLRPAALKGRVTRLARLVYDDAVPAGRVLLPGVPKAPALDGTLVILNKGNRPEPGVPHNSSVMLVNLRSGRLKALLPARSGPHEIAVSKNRRWAAIPNYGGQAQESGMETGGGTSISFLDVAEGTLSHMDLPGWFRPHGVEWLDPATIAVTVNGTRDSIAKGSVLYIDVAKRRILAALPTGQPGTHLVRQTADRRRLWVSNIQGGSMVVFERPAGKSWASALRYKAIPTGAGTEGFDLHEARREVWVGAQGADTVTILDMDTMKPKGRIRVPGGPIRTKFTPDGTRAVVTLRAGNALAVIDVATRRELFRIPMEVPYIDGKGPGVGRTSTPMMVEFDPTNADRLYVGNSHSRLVSVVDLARRKVVGYYKGGDKPDPLAVIPAGD